jgi:protein-export membrane protein SecD
MKRRIFGIIVFLLGLLLTFLFVFSSSQNSSGETRKPFRLGLDLKGGTSLTYKADTSGLVDSDVADAVSVLRDVIERRVNLFGVSEPVVLNESVFGEERIIVELPGITDIDSAIKSIGETPSLEFRLLKEEFKETGIPENAILDPNVAGSEEFISAYFDEPVLTGKYLKRASVEFDPNSGEPVVLINFNEEGSKIFEEVTTVHTGEALAIFLDGELNSAPIIRDTISGGEAVISGSFLPEEAKSLARNLNFGALPLPIELIGTELVGPSLGAEAINAGLKASLIGFLVVVLFMIAWYRLPGVIASISLSFYVVIILFLFKLIPVTLTAAGLAGFIISVGIAVDANILIFERIKEERRKGKNIRDAVEAGFGRAWTSIRDSNFSGILTSLILFWFGTSIIRGFALTLGLGIAVSLFTAVFVTKAMLKAITPDGDKKWFVFGSGFSLKKSSNSNNQ